jgi:hypothetical protein
MLTAMAPKILFLLPQFFQNIYKMFQKLRKLKLETIGLKREKMKK